MAANPMSAGPMAAKYEALSLRERALVALAMLAVCVLAWDSLLMAPLRQEKLVLDSELMSASAAGFDAQGADMSDPRQANLKLAAQLQTQMQGLDAQIADTASGFVSSHRMIEVLHDVLHRQGRLQLVSIRNLPVVSLVPPANEATGLEGAPTEVASAVGNAPASPGEPPYVHAIEMVIEGRYADILEYLEALESLPWKFRWSSLDLSTAGYPLNRVRIELSTLSLDAPWLGV